MRMLNVSDNRRFLSKEDGSPFFYLGDTAWGLFQRLNREEAERYLTVRSEQRFTVVQAAILAEDNGLSDPNAYGHVPLHRDESGAYDPTRPKVNADGDDYWQHVDFVVQKAADLGLVMGIVPTWGDKVVMGNPFAKGPEIFNRDNARAFGRYVGARYKNQPNIVWILGGDRNPYGKIDVWRALAEGLREGDEGAHLITYHPEGLYSSSIWFHHDSWLDFHTHQSGHFARNQDNYNMIAKDYALYPPKPTFDIEPRYEGHSVNWNEKLGYFNDYDARQPAYWQLMSGACGHTYGHTSVWQFYDPEAGRESYSGASAHWQDALNSPGAEQMRHLRALVDSHPFLQLAPDQALVVDPLAGADHIRAARGESYAYIYSATGQPFEVRMGLISGSAVRARWFDPRSGAWAAVTGVFANGGLRRFEPPTSGIGEDWVLVLDDAAPSAGSVATSGEPDLG
ncbi:glycoside hydrolase family 140 protein [Cohnella sp. GCM10027633]|uniref:glycoside hydrolase family 140 protein n=1 Tax=unclassified Cohnella TaxID=2636738 RepID=UPI00362D4AD6